MPVTPEARTLIASAAYTATQNVADQINLGHRGCHVVIDATVKGGAAPSIVYTIQGKDRTSGKYYTILASAAVVAVGTTVLKVYPGITAAANASVSDVLPECWRVIATAGNSDSMTYSVGVSLIP